jgi:hypothetical protein
MKPSTIGGINQLPEEEKRRIYYGLIPRELLEHFHLPRIDAPQFDSFIQFQFAPGSSNVEMSLFHELNFPDPILYGHLTDTVNGQIHVLLYVLSDPASPRYDVDRMPDGRATEFGTLTRNLEAEQAALEAGLAPGQVRRGLRLLQAAVIGFENFIEDLGHDLYFVEPLYYHNAVIFERYGFAYQQGRKLMERIHQGFSNNGDLINKLDGSTFRLSNTVGSIRLRSWAIHDGILGEPFTNVTMYKRIGRLAGISTTADTNW